MRRGIQGCGRSAARVAVIALHKDWEAALNIYDAPVYMYTHINTDGTYKYSGLYLLHITRCCKSRVALQQHVAETNAAQVNVTYFYSVTTMCILCYSCIVKTYKLHYHTLSRHLVHECKLIAVVLSVCSIISNSILINIIFPYILLKIDTRIH